MGAHMLRTNVIPKTYRVTLRTPSGMQAVSTIDAESIEAARLKAPCPPGWEIAEVVPA